MLATTSGQLVGTGTTAPLQPLGGTLQTSPFQPVPTAPPTTAPAPAPAPTATAAPAPAPYGTSQYGALPAAGAVYNTADGKWYPSGSYFSTNTGKMITINGQAAQPLAQQSLPATPTASGTGSAAGPGTATSSQSTNYSTSPFAPLQQPLLTAGQNSLTGGQTAYNTGLDPQNALHDRTAQQLQDQVRTSEAARGITMSPYGAGVENQAMSNFNIDWQNNLLNRQVTGLNALNSSIGTGASLLDMGATTTKTDTASLLDQQLKQAQINRENQLSAPAPSVTSEVMAPATPIPDWAKTATTGGAATTGGLLGFPTGGGSSGGMTGASPYTAAPPAPLSGGGYTGGGYAAPAPATSGGTAGGATAAQPSVAEAASVAAQYLLKTNEDVLNLASMLWAE